MKAIGIHLDEETVRQMKELAQLWGLPKVRHNTAVFQRCVERVWMQEIGCHQDHDTDKQNARSIDNTS